MSRVDVLPEGIWVDWGSGSLSVQPDGSIVVSVDDDYHGGTIEPQHALQLAEAIRLRARKSEG